MAAGATGGVVTTGSSVGMGAAVVAGAEVVTVTIGAGAVWAFAVAISPPAIPKASKTAVPPATADFVSIPTA